MSFMTTHRKRGLKAPQVLPWGLLVDVVVYFCSGVGIIGVRLQREL
jgi:hypothetical protein